MTLKEMAEDILSKHHLPYYSREEYCSYCSGDELVSYPCDAAELAQAVLRGDK